MTRKEQNKILNDKIKANNAQYNLDRMNAELSAYSSGDLPKYEYLTNKDLGYKPDAFEKAKFEYSPLGKVFTDGLDKSDKNEGLLKRLKNIEDKSNNQLLTIKNTSRPAIKGENNGNVSDEYKTIQDFKQELIDKNILLHLNSVKKCDNIIDKWKQTKDKEIVYKNVDTKVNTKKFNIFKIFENYLNKKIDYDGLDMIERSIKNGIKIHQKRRRKDKNKSIINNSNKVVKGIELFKIMVYNDEFKIPEEYYAGPNNNVDLDWMNDKIRYEETAEEADTVYMKGNNDNELKLIKDFITKINNGTINKNNAGNEFRKLKQKVTNDRLREDLIKDLERYIFGEDIESINPEEKYEESIAERVKTRRQNTQRTFAPQDSSINLDNFTYGENYDELDEEDREFLRNMNKEEKGFKILTNKQMLNRLPILLAQIQAGNNSIKLKNEIRQILYSLYRSKVLTKTVYNNLIKSIR